MDVGPQITDDHVIPADWRARRGCGGVAVCVFSAKNEDDGSSINRAL